MDLSFGGHNRTSSTDGASTSSTDALPSENATPFTANSTEQMKEVYDDTTHAILDDVETSTTDVTSNDTWITRAVTMVTQIFQGSEETQEPSTGNVMTADSFMTTESFSMTESFTTTESIKTTKKLIRSAHDLPVVGVAEGQIVSIHSVALTCIAVSFCCASAVIIASFRHRRVSSFFKWNKTDRLVIYLALCDWIFNLVHSLDHGQVLATYEHVNPPELCLFYAFVLVQFVVGQILLVNVTAIDICVMLFANKRLNFGRWDWRVLTYIMGVPFLVGTISLATNQLGFNGVFCFFDTVTGQVANMLCTSVLFWIITLTDTVLYVITWIKLNREAKRHKATLGPSAAGVKATHKAAKNMSMLVLAYICQWWTLGMYGTWLLIAEPPMPFYQLSTSFANMGGLLNGIVFVLIRRRMFADDKRRGNVQMKVEALANDRCQLKAVSLSKSGDSTASTETSPTENHI